MQKILICALSGLTLSALIMGILSTPVEGQSLPIASSIEGSIIEAMGSGNVFAGPTRVVTDATSGTIFLHRAGGGDSFKGTLTVQNLGDSSLTLVSSQGASLAVPAGQGAGMFFPITGNESVTWTASGGTNVRFAWVIRNFIGP